MARVFAITATPETLALDAQGRGEVSFSVTNTSARPLRARARVVPLGAAQAAWFEAPTEPEQTLAAGATHAYRVGLRLPAGVAPGQFSVRLDVDSVERPDEDFTEGPAVAFAVKAAAPAPPRPAFPWWILAVVLVVLVVGGVVAAVLLRGRAPKLGAPCRDGACAAGLTCAVESNTCLGDVGFKGCSSSADCALGACRDGVCVDTTGEACQKADECAANETCTSLGICQRVQDAPCTSAGQCATQVCQEQRCRTLPLKARCSADVQCASKHCVGDRCVELLPLGAECRRGDECASGFCLMRLGQIGGRCSRRFFDPSHRLDERARPLP